MKKSFTEHIYGYLVMGKLSDIVLHIESLIAKYGPDAQVVDSTYYYREEADYYVEWTREETDQEKELREKREARIAATTKELKDKQRLQRIAKEKKEYARLKKKYDDK